MHGNPSNLQLIHAFFRYDFVIAEFLSKEQQEKVASLQIQPFPDQLIRVYALFQASSSTGLLCRTGGGRR